MEDEFEDLLGHGDLQGSSSAPPEYDPPALMFTEAQDDDVRLVIKVFCG